MPIWTWGCIFLQIYFDKSLAMPSTQFLFYALPTIWINLNKNYTSMRLLSIFPTHPVSFSVLTDNIITWRRPTFCPDFYVCHLDLSANHWLAALIHSVNNNNRFSKFQVFLQLHLGTISDIVLFYRSKSLGNHRTPPLTFYTARWRIIETKCITG